MSCKIRIKNLEQKVGQKAPPVIIASSSEEADQKFCDYRRSFPHAPNPVVLIPTPIKKKERPGSFSDL